MSFSLANGQNLTCQVYVDTPLAMGFSMDQVDYEEFLITLVAPDPNLYSTVLNTTNISLPVGGGTAIPTAIPISLAASSGGSAVINNAGANSAYPIITITAPITNPFITNLTTNQFTKLNYTLNVGDASIVIDMNAQTIKKGLNDISSFKTIDSTFWSLLSGNNTIGFNATSGTGQATVNFYPSFLGV